jgi:hypothetical protein
MRRMQRLFDRRLQVLHRLCGLLRVQLWLLPFVGSLPLHLLGASPFHSDCVRRRGGSIRGPSTRSLRLCPSGCGRAGLR